jgi:hypothetical protein
LKLQSVKIEGGEADARPVSVVEDVDNATFERLKAPKAQMALTFVLHEVKDFIVFRSKPVPDVDVAAAEKQRDLAP